MDVKVRKTNHPKLVSLTRNLDIYDMSHPVRGWCLIFALSNYNHLDKLIGYSTDAQNLGELFRQLNFKTKVYENKPINYIKEKLAKHLNKPLANNSNGGGMNAFVTIILAHGSQNEILDLQYNPRLMPQENANHRIQINSILELFNNQNCPILKGKPKMIFIQACRGEKVDLGMRSPIRDHNYDNYNLDDNDSQGSQDYLFEPNTASAAGNQPTLLNEIESLQESIKSVPSRTDVMICYSALDDHQSYVHRDGSVFGKSLVDIISRFSYSTDLQHLINKLSNEMNDQDIPITDQVCKQTVSVHYDGWIKKLYFNPGCPKTKPKKIIRQNPTIEKLLNQKKKLRQSTNEKINQTNLRIKRAKEQISRKKKKKKKVPKKLIKSKGW